MKKEPKAVYIIENGGYTELTYEEFRRREQICPLYADKLFLPLYGSLMEVSKEDYEEYYRQRNRQIYIDRRASRNGDVSYNALTTDEFNGEDIIARLHTSGAMNAADYAMQTSEIGNRLTELRIERRQKLTEDENDQLLATLKDLNGILDEYEPTVEFENGLFDEIVESITVDSSEQLTFKLIGGIALTEQIPKKGR